MTRRPFKLPAVPPEFQRQAADAIAAAVAEAARRNVGMTKLAALAAKHGIAFDLTAAINGGISLAAARRQVGDALADANEDMLTLCRSTSASAESVNHKQGWDAALSAVTARMGLGN